MRAVDYAGSSESSAHSSEGAKENGAVEYVILEELAICYVF